MNVKNSSNRIKNVFLKILLFLLVLIVGLPSMSAATGENIIITVAGDGTAGCTGNGGPAIDASMDSLSGVAVDTLGSLYISVFNLTSERLIRKVDSSGIITTVAGVSSTEGCAGDGSPATQIMIAPQDFSVDFSGNIIFPSYDRIRLVDPSGNISIIAGGGATLGDGGPATDAQVFSPMDVALDNSGNLYIADTGQYRIRKVDATGIITTIAGTGVAGYTGDGGPATAAKLGFISSLALDPSGNIYIADIFHHLVRKIDTSGIITTVAGTGTAGYAGDDGPAAAALLNNPWGLAVDSSGDLYIADSGNNRIRKVDTSGIITTVAGTGTAGYAGDGDPAAAAFLNNPWALAVDSSDNLYIADAGNNRIRKVFLSGYVLGDVAPRGAPDGIVDVADALVMMRLASGLITPTPEEILRGNVAPKDNPDGQIDMADSLLVLRASLGLILLSDDDIDGDGYTPSQGDCNNNDPTIYPGAPEIDCDGIDQDCDGSDSCPTTCTDNDGDGYGDPGDASCPNGSALDCDDTDPAVNPGATETPYNGKDDDCNPATLDDDLDGDGYPIATDCDDNDGTIYPGAPEINCDGIDQDCDGLDSCPTTCIDNDGDGYGNPGDASCPNGSALDCDDTDPDTYPGATELCDGVDNDCDGSIDENLTQPTTCGVGACAGNTGIETCTSGVWGGDTCDPLAGATTEVCDNIDNDCDGSIDENLTQPTTCGVGACAGNTGSETCTAGVWGGDTCDPLTGATTEVCDGLDNDCDGQVDEGCVITSITISPQNIVLSTIGATQQLTVTGLYNDGSTTDLTASSTGTTYSSDDPTVASVNTEGLITAVSNGTAIITAANAGLIDTTTVSVQTGSVPPQITINSPQNNSTIGTLTPFIDIAYTASGTPLDLSTLKITINGGDKTSDFTVTSSNASYQTISTDPIFEDVNTIDVALADTSGTYANETFTFTVDLDPPEFTIINLPEGISTVDSAYTLIGAIDSDVTSVTVGGVDATISGGYFISNPVSLSLGTNTITIVLTDNVGNTSTQTITIDQTGNTQGISAAVTSPMNGTTINADAVDILGTYTGTPSLIMVNNVQATMAGGAFTAKQVPLTVGTNPIVVAAYDSAGNLSSFTILLFTNNTNETLTLTSFPSIGLAPLPVTLTANTTLSGITNYDWDLDGDGTIDANTTINTTTTTYTAVRRYFPTVTVNSGGIQYSGTLLVETTLPETLSASTTINSPIDIIHDSATGEIYVLNGAAIEKYDATLSTSQTITSLSVTPASFAVDFSTGKIYYTDTINNEIKVFDPVDSSTTTFNSGLTSPYGIAIDQNGEILVSDGNQILGLDASGSVKETITGDPNSVFKGLFIDFIGDIYAVDSPNNKIIQYSSGGSKELEFGTAGSGDGEFAIPMDVSVDEINDQILVADTGNNRIQIFDKDGNFIRTITDDGSGTPLNAPTGAASGTFDPGQFILAADTGNSRVVKIELPVPDPTLVWNAMKAELINGDVQAALDYFSDGSKAKYSQVFTDVGANLSSLATAMNPVRKSFIKGGVAEYKIDRDVDLSGQTYTLTFPVYFEKDENGIWKIVSF